MQKIKLHSPMLLNSYTHSNPRFSYGQVGHIYPWTKDNGIPVMPSCILTLEGFWHSRSHQVLLLPLHLIPTLNYFFKQYLDFYFFFFFFKIVSSSVKHTVLSPRLNTAFFSDSVHQIQWRFICRTMLTCSFPATQRTLLFLVWLCLVLLGVNKNALSAVCVASPEEPGKPLPCGALSKPSGKGDSSCVAPGTI